MWYYNIRKKQENKVQEKRKNMRESFRRKVVAHGIYDTKKYRWIYDYKTNTIIRIPIEYLGTTRALSDWEIVESEVL